MKKESVVSVIITVYNYKYNISLEAVFKGWRQQTISTEIILCEQSIERDEKLAELCNRNHVRYIHCLPDLINGMVRYNIGRVRNIAALLSKCKYLYFNDADVLVYRKDYLEELINFSESNNKIPLMRPFSRRLQSNYNEVFATCYCGNPEINFHEEKYFCKAIFNENSMSIDVIPEGERYRLMNNILHVCTASDLNKMIEQDAKYMEEFPDIWQTAMHYGGLFVSYDNFIKVCGYCEQYFNWGYEDIDIQWKLDAYTGIQFIDSAIRNCGVLHFEHNSRRQNEIYTLNNAVFERRKKAGQQKAVKGDTEKCDSFISAYLRQDKTTMIRYVKEAYINDIRK